jgi:hypothetical protein
MSHGTIELEVTEASNVEARVYARYVPGDNEESPVGAPVTLRGKLRGPYCERAHTLPAEYVFRELGPENPDVAVAVVPDPCLWSEELPHLYHADIEAARGDEVVAEYHGVIGLRRAAV